MKREQFLLAFLAFFYIIYGHFIDSPSFQNLAVLGCFALFQLFFSIISWLKYGNRLISPYPVFLLTLYLFSIGQSLLYPFHIISEKDLIGFRGITVEDVFRAQTYTLILLASFHFGACFCINKPNKCRISPVFFDRTKTIKQLGWFLFIISIVPFFQDLIHFYILSMKYGYGTIYEEEARVGIYNFIGIIGDFFIPSLICLFVAYRNDFSKRLFVEILMLCISIVILLTGGRTKAVILITTWLIMYNYLVRFFSKKMMAIIFVCAIFLLGIMSNIAKTRVEEHRYISSIEFGTSSNDIVDAIGEMGSSMFCLIESQKIVPDYSPHRYGKSYIFSFTTLIPNLGFWTIHPAKEEANLSEWLTKTLNLSYGTGFSMCAEAYVNFGGIGFLAFMLFGYLLSSFFGKLETAKAECNLPQVVFILVFFWFALKLPRNSFISIVRSFFFYTLPIFWISRGYLSKKAYINSSTNSIKK